MINILNHFHQESWDKPFSQAVEHLDICPADAGREHHDGNAVSAGNAGNTGNSGISGNAGGLEMLEMLEMLELLEVLEMLEVE